MNVREYVSFHKNWCLYEHRQFVCNCFSMKITFKLNNQSLGLEVMGQNALFMLQEMKETVDDFGKLKKHYAYLESGN